MKRPKRIVFTAATRIDLQGALAFFASAASTIAATASAIKSMSRVVQAVERFGHSVMASPEFQQKAKMQQLYFESWQANELADTLQAAGIGRRAPY